MTKAEASVRSMTEEQIAESLALTPRCMSGYEGSSAYANDLLALEVGADVIRGNGRKPEEVKICVTQLSHMAAELVKLPQWEKRALVYERAVKIIKKKYSEL